MAGGTWYASEQSCNFPFTCPSLPPHDDCANAVSIPVGSPLINNSCTTTDGYNPVETDRGIESIRRDLWFQVRIPDAVPGGMCDLLASLCGSGAAGDGSSTLDSVIAVYHDAANPEQCPCPVTQMTHDDTFLQAGNENCYGSDVNGPGFVEVRDAQAGHCYTLRIGGAAGSHETGAAQLSVTCGPAYCGDNRRNGNEQCDGADTGLCGPNFSCNPDCTCGATFICGDGIITTPVEECDPGAFPTCVVPSICDFVTCKCLAFCGNNHIEQGEDCDGIATDGDCPPAVCTPQCECPTPVCGNGTLEDWAGEECEFDFDCPLGGACRDANDPLGGCTCACVPLGTCGGVVAPTADPSGIRQNRYISFTPGNPGIPMAIRVKLVDLQNPVPPNLPGSPPPNFSAFEAATCTAPGGCVRWVGPPVTSPDAPPTGVTFKSAALQCTPHYQDWGAVGLLRAYGSETLPSSIYEVQVLAQGCDQGVDTDYSDPLLLYTARWGDVVANFNPPSTTTQPDGLDVSAMVDKWRGHPLGKAKFQIQLGPNVPNPTKRIDTVDLALAVDAFAGRAYSLRGPITCPYPPNCPNGFIERGEECDDGNATNGDGCSSTCRAETRTAVMSLVPVAPYDTAVPPYTAGTVISGPDIFVQWGERIWIELRLSGWDANLDGVPRLSTWQAQLDANGFSSGETGTLTPASKPCSGNADCTAAFGPGSVCGYSIPGFCASAFRDGQHPNGTPAGFSAGFDLGMPPSFRIGSGTTSGVIDPGSSVYAGTIVLDVPDGAMGRFTISLDPSLLNTYMFDSTLPARVPIPITLRPAFITVVGKNRFLTINRAPTVTAGAAAVAPTALRVWMIDLHHPNPRNAPQFVPTNFTTFDTRDNGVCNAGTHIGHHCDSDADCRVCASIGPKGSVPCATNLDCGICDSNSTNPDAPCDDNGDCPGGLCRPGTCSPALMPGVCAGLASCTAPGELLGCARFVGPPATFLESQERPQDGSFRAARLQCTPYYHDWANERRVHVTGPEVVPSSVYKLEALTAGGDVSGSVPLFTARYGDVTKPYAPPAFKTAPDSLDVAVLVDKFKKLYKIENAATKLSPNVIRLDIDVDALDITLCVDAFGGRAYAQSGPCACPSTVPCDGTQCANDAACALIYGAGALCIPTCNGGANDGLPCGSNKDCNYCAQGTRDGLPCPAGTGDPCPGGGTCSTDGVCGPERYCRDRCGRCGP